MFFTWLAQAETFEFRIIETWFRIKAQMECFGYMSTNSKREVHRDMVKRLIVSVSCVLCDLKDEGRRK